MINQHVPHSIDDQVQNSKFYMVKNIMNWIKLEKKKRNRNIKACIGETKEIRYFDFGTIWLKS